MEKLQGDGFDSQDVVEFLVAPVLYDDNVYKRDEPRKLNQVKTKVDSEPHLDELDDIHYYRVDITKEYGEKETLHVYALNERDA